MIGAQRDLKVAQGLRRGRVAEDASDLQGNERRS